MVRGHDSARRLYRALLDQQIPFKSASIAFYTIASIAPFVVLVLAVFSLVQATDLLVEELQPILPANASDALRQLLADTSSRRLTSGIGIVVTVWSASRLFRALSIAFTDIYEAEARFGLLTHLVRSLFVLAGFLLALVLLAVTAALLTTVDFQVRFPTFVGNVVAVVVLMVVFFPLYYTMPPKSVTVRHALPGTVLAAAGWVLLQVAFFYYARFAGPYAAFSVLGALVLFVSFLYLAANVILFGALLNASLDWQ